MDKKSTSYKALAEPHLDCHAGLLQKCQYILLACKALMSGKLIFTCLDE